MTNNWEYASVGQRDRLKMIRNGNKDVYNSEKERNKELKRLQEELGLSTTDIDDWDATIDDAYSKYKAKTSEVITPKYALNDYDDILKSFYSTRQELREQKQQDIDDAKQEAKSSYDYLLEWLANNGFSGEGKTAKTEKAELEEGYTKLIEEIRKQYDEQLKSLEEGFVSSMLSLLSKRRA